MNVTHWGFWTTMNQIHPEERGLADTFGWFTKFPGSWECLPWKPQKWGSNPGSLLLKDECCLEACYISELDFQPTGKMHRRASLRALLVLVVIMVNGQLGAGGWQTHW